MASIPALRYSPAEPQFPRNSPAPICLTQTTSSNARPAVTRAVVTATIMEDFLKHFSTEHLQPSLTCAVTSVLLYPIPRLLRSSPETAPCFCVGLYSAVTCLVGGEIYCINVTKGRRSQGICCNARSSSLSQSSAAQYISKILVPRVPFMSIEACLSPNCPIGTPVSAGALRFSLG
jgi:hypothetical protein